MSKILLDNVWMEDVFQWLYDHITDAGGDGSGAVVCSNYEETAEQFIEWYRNKFKKDKFFHDPDMHFEGMINFHDSNENFIFTNIKDIDKNWFGSDYLFIVTTPCSNFKGNFKILP